MIPVIVASAWVLAGAELFVMVGLMHADTMWTAHEQDMARLTAPLAPPREDLSEVDSERVNNEYQARHRYEPAAIGSAAQMAGLRALREPTDAFQVLVEANWDTGERAALVWRCESCRGVVADGEPAHLFCPGCPCPCTLVEPVLIGRPPAYLYAHMRAVSNVAA